MEIINRGWAPELGGRASAAAATAIVLIKQLWEIAKKAIEEAALLEDL